MAPGTARTHHTQFQVPREFATTLAKGQPDRVYYTARRLAQDHQIKLLFRILVDKSLPVLTLKSQFGANVIQQADEVDAARGCFYRRYECQLDWQSVGGVAVFDVKLER